MKKSVLLSVFLACAACFGQEAVATVGTVEEAISSETASSVNDDVKAYVVEKTSSMLLEEAFAAFAKERGIDAYGTKNAKGVMYITGQATVPVNVNSPDFVKGRTVAFEKALRNATSKMVMDLTGQEMMEEVSKYFSDQSDDRLEPPKDFAESKSTILKKLKGLSEAALDEGLRKLGKNPDDYGNKVETKRKLFQDEIFTKAVRKAIGKSSGYLPVQTFETRSADGNYSIGVVLRYDYDTIEIAQSIYRKKLPLVRSTSGLSISDALPSNEEMLNQFGVRLFFDEKGQPALLSFGCWGSSYTGKDVRRQERAMEHAFRQAESMANTQLTRFINSTISMVEQSERSENEYEGVSFDSMDNATEESFVKYVDRIMSETRVKGSDSMIGRSTVKKVTLIHPSGHKIAYVVRLWSFDTLASNKSILSGKRPVEQKQGQPAAPVKKEDSGVRQGRVYDF
ncbi:MAG: hypothetical protein IJS08_05070 [Victivallales bacterium]|nr:hypothetical protein [Victivallales bacterium]